MQSPLFSKKPVAIAVSLAMGTLGSAALRAQEEAAVQTANNDVIEEVVVMGIRSSLKRAMDTKRDSAGVVDAISAEDIGDFPDTNLAEALQRITGVSINRERGEGTTVTVRGFGADFNLVTLNGRQMPTHSGFGRSFDFQDIAAESVSGVEVYKTSRANIPTGGIGATINVKTARPLDNPGFRTSLSAKAVYDESTREGDEYTPELAAFVSQTFLDDTVGIAISGTFQERHNGQVSASSGGWLSRDGGTIPDNGLQTNAPSAGDLVSLPRQIGYQLDEWERTRINGQITLQWQPIETLTATLDYTMAQLELDHRYNNMSLWYNRTGQQGVWTDGPVVSPLVYTEFNDAPDFPMGAGIDASKNTRDGIGFNLEWDPTDRLSLFLDWHDSNAERSPNNERFGSSALLSIAAFGRVSSSTDWTTEVPVTTTVASDPLSPDDMQIVGSVFSNSWAEMNIEQTRFGGMFDITDTLSLDFGVTQTQVENFESGSNVQRNTWGQNQASAYGTISDLMVPASLSGLFSELSGGDQVNNNFFMWDMAEVVDRAEFLQSLDPSNPLYLAPGFLGGDCGTGFCADNDRGFGNQFEEDSLAFYLQLNYSGEMFDRPFNMRVGYRYEETDVTSSAESLNYTRIEWASLNEFNAIEADETVPSSLQGSYSVGLPNFDFDIELMDDLIFRASYSETIARAGYGDLRGNLSIGNILRVNQGEFIATGTLGNPGLIPHESQNIDLSLEYYYDDASYVSVGYFDKSVENFVISAEQQDVVLFEQLAHPALGPLYQSAIQALGANAVNQDIRDYIFANFANEPGVDAVNQVITGVPGRDDPAFFDVQTRINSDRTADIDGWELAWQHNFWDTGFGFIANMTLADGSAQYDNTSNDPGQFALPGLSDTRNFVLFYETDYFQVRAAYNWRDKFFTGGVVDPSYTEEYEQWDMSASYEFGESGFIAFVEGINITNETFRSSSRTETQMLAVGQLGARYNIGVRYSY
jgi:TonB-dependent receptor